VRGGFLAQTLQEGVFANRDAAAIIHDLFAGKIVFVEKFHLESSTIVLWLLVNEPEARLLAELKWLRHNQAALDARLQRVEESVVFRALRAIGTFYQAHFHSEALGDENAYAEWAARHMRNRLAPDPAWGYQPLIGIVPCGGDLRSVEAQNYKNWEIDSGRAEYVAELAEGVVLAPDALSRAVAAMQGARPGCVYFDHEIAGERLRPVFKPDWSPVLMESCDYMGDFTVHTREPRNGMVHVPHVCYSTRSGLSFRDAAFVPEGKPVVSILICTRNGELLTRCLAALRAKTDYQPVEIVVVHHTGSGDDERIIKAAANAGAAVVPFSGAFNFSGMNNLGARAAKGDIVLFLNDDVEPLDSIWLERMVAHLERAETGAVGAKLLYPNGTIQHAGIVTWEMDGAGHIGRNMTASEYWPWLNCTREVTAVTGACLAIRRADFEAVGGFDPAFPVNFNDVDLCLRLREKGLSVIFDAGAVLQHDEGQTRARGVSFEERRRFFLRWHELLERTDPFYSPNLVQNIETVELRD
jgi:GT2 family glycosyltransferase